MHQDTKDLCGHRLTATDGDIGHIRDFYFDDTTWMIRYLVADTGNWLPGRLVLISPHSLGRFDPVSRTLGVALSRVQIDGCPPIDTHRPLSRQKEDETCGFYGWPRYWQDGAAWGVAGADAPGIPPDRLRPPHHGHNQRDDMHLRSTVALTGYALHATDGEIGTVASFIINTATWAIHDIVVRTGPWYSGREIRIAPGRIGRMSYDECAVHVALAMADIRATADGALARASAG